jgi:hypothetical protein
LDYTEKSFLDPLSVRDGTNELLLWKQPTAATEITEDGEIEDVVLKPQLTQVKLKLDCSYEGKNITGVSSSTPITLTSGFTGGNTYNLAGGALVTAVSSSALPFEWTTSTFNATTVTSDTLTLVPQTGFTLTIPANAITMETGVSQNTLTEIPFPTSALEAGKTHTISVKLVKSYTKFAASNIYWVEPTDGNPGYLTFDPYLATPENGPGTNKNYQGVYFRFGSLIGISPVGDWSANATTGTPIYVPYYGDGTNPKWVESKAGKTNDDVSGITGATAHPAWTWPSDDANPIPYVSENDGSSSRDATWVKDNYGSSSWSAYKGDICQYISTTQDIRNSSNEREYYRLPTSNEFGRPNETNNPTIVWSTSSTPIDGWLKVGSSWSATSNDATGKCTDIVTGGKYGYTGNFFPASGYRRGGYGSMDFTGSFGLYWSGSVLSSNGYCLDLHSSDVLLASAGGRTNGFAVRCVLQ